ncbi:hypothetical protein F511_38116 [Dorcoceras hygrometricum]|uniref:Uncharacterized protein n=1 Tax=Dorcoceras hygrometricum TaxID=472368 RepID=A0A2Z7D9E7_9LAMI|nr:hypothetical protein F511_38116 [Dorcoceras hygrometricum]
MICYNAHTQFEADLNQLAKLIQLRPAHLIKSLQKEEQITSIRSTTGYETPSSACTRRSDEIGADGFSSKDWPEQFPAKEAAAAAALGDGGGGFELSDGFGSGPTGPGPTDEHSVHPHHRDFIVTPITDQIGPIDSVSKTEYYDMINYFSELQCKMTVLPLNSGNHDLTPVDF